MFFNNLYKFTSVKKILKVLEVVEDKIFLFVLMRNIVDFSPGDKEKVFQFVQERISDEALLSVVDECIEYYNKKIDKDSKLLPYKYFK